MFERGESSRRHIFFLVCAAFILNVFFFSFEQKFFFAGLTTEHGEIGYNLFRHNSIRVNKKRVADISARQNSVKHLVDYADVDHSLYEEPQQFRSIHDTIGYGVLLGMMWKVTRSLRYSDVQWLQIILFSLSMILVYQLGWYLFSNRSIALYSSIAFLCFFPVLFLNIRALRDIWGYYGLLVLLWVIVREKKVRSSAFTLIVASLFITACQWLRPTIFFQLVGLLCVFSLLSHFAPLKRRLVVCGLLILVNLFLFWVPFVQYNYQAYGQPMVSCTGHDLLYGLGELPDNPWSYPRSDEEISELIYSKYGRGINECLADDLKKRLFIQAVCERPYVFVRSMVYRLPTLWIFNPLWTNGPDAFLKGNRGLLDTLKEIAWHPLAFLIKLIDFSCARLYYVPLYLLLGWIGFLFMAFFRFREALVLGTALVASWSKFISHMEPRYQVISYWVFAYGIGFLVWFVVKRTIKRSDDDLQRAFSRAT